MSASSTSANPSATDDIDGAIERWLAADAASSIDATGLADLIALLARANRDDEASVYAARLLRLRPTHRRALRALTRSPRPDVDVIGGWRALAGAMPDDVEPWLQIARLASRAKDHETALQACDEMLDREPGHVEALNLKLGALLALRTYGDLGPVWRRLYEADAARGRAILTRVVEGADADAAAAMLGEAGSLGVLDGGGEHQRLKLRSRLTVAAYDAELAGNDPAAAQNFWRLTRLEPKDANHADGLKRAVYRLRACVDGAGEAPSAESASAARMLTRFDPHHRKARLVLGRALSLTGGWQEAADAFSQALLIAIDEHDGPLLLEHATACARCGRLAEATESWKRARGLAHDDPDATAQVGRAQALLRGMAEAGHEVALDNSDWRAAWASRDALEDLEGDGPATDERTKRLLKATAKAMNHAADERSPETVELAQLYLSGAPDDGRARLILGRALLRERRNEEALSVWQTLAAERPDSFEPALQVARLAKRLEMAELGREAADQVLALEPGHDEARALRTHFDETRAPG
jgi:tetratricopeptide (TPR) repeat protein